jgi:hypothetical protein
MKTTLSRMIGVTVLMLSVTSALNAQTTIKLPAPRIKGQVMNALENRVSFKGFSARELSLETLADLLWAGFGVNDKRTGRRTAASAFNSQEIDIYVIMAAGAYKYNARAETLEQVAPSDLRGLVARQDYAKAAAVHLLYVADHKRSRNAFVGSYKNQVEQMGYFHAGMIAQNVYLFCAAKELATVVRSSIDFAALGRELKLTADQQIVMSQTVGFPGK